jgi:hypothetical protein
VALHRPVRVPGKLRRGPVSQQVQRAPQALRWGTVARLALHPYWRELARAAV